MVGAVFVYSPAEILVNIGGSKLMWIVLIFVYYIIATMLPIDKIIGKVYPLFSFSLLFMAVALMAVLFIKWPVLPEVWDGLGNMAKQADPQAFADDIFPCMFITIACGAVSGFHATQSPLMARCLTSERKGRPIFYGAMITEGLVALVWATVAMWFFYDAPQPGYGQIGDASASGLHTSAPVVVNLVCCDWLGVVGGILAMLGVVAAPITTGDTAFRSARLIIAQAFRLSQRKKINRIYICVPVFAVSLALLVWQIQNPDGFNTIWKYFGWANQTLAVFTLWTLTVYLVQEKKAYILTLVPALFMTVVCVSFLMVSNIAFALPPAVGYAIGGGVGLATALWFMVWLRKMRAGARE